MPDAIRTLEEAFFLQEDQKLIEKLRRIKKQADAKQKLAELFGVQDEALLQKLMELDIQPETVAAMALVPVIEVAWADGEMQSGEKDAILAMAAKSGVQKGSDGYEMLDRWLLRKPDPVLLHAWTHYVRNVCKTLSAVQRDELKNDLLKKARSVAEVAGGFFGLGNKVSDAEQAMLKKLESAFGGSAK
jgi:hypothetical protein